MTALSAEAGSDGTDGANAVPDGAVPADRAHRRTGLWLGASSLALVIAGPMVARLTSTLPYPAPGWLDPFLIAVLAVPLGMALGVTALIVNIGARRSGRTDTSTRWGMWLGGSAVLVGVGLIGLVVAFAVLAIFHAGGIRP